MDNNQHSNLAGGYHNYTLSLSITWRRKIWKQQNKEWRPAETQDFTFTFSFSCRKSKGSIGSCTKHTQLYKHFPPFILLTYIVVAMLCSQQCDQLCLLGDRSSVASRISIGDPFGYAIVHMGVPLTLWALRLVC